MINRIGNSNSNRCLTSFALQTSFDMTVKFFERKSGVLRRCRKTPLFPPPNDSRHSEGAKRLRNLYQIRELVNKMEKPYFHTANLSSTSMLTQPSTLFPYFSLNKEIREGEIVAVATKGAVRNKGFRIRCVNNKNI